jgi:hypothetical protein
MGTLGVILVGLSILADDATVPSARHDAIVMFVDISFTKTTLRE